MHYHRDLRTLRCLQHQQPAIRLEPAAARSRTPLIDTAARALLALILLAAIGATITTIATSCKATPASVEVRRGDVR